MAGLNIFLKESGGLKPTLQNLGYQVTRRTGCRISGIRISGGIGGQCPPYKKSRSSKYEARNSKQIQMFKIKNSKRDCRVGLRRPRNDGEWWISKTAWAKAHPTKVNKNYQRIRTVGQAPPYQRCFNPSAAPSTALRALAYSGLRHRYPAI